MSGYESVFENESGISDIELPEEELLNSEEISNVEQVETDSSETEFIGHTEVSAFDNCELLTTEEVCSHLRENIPQSHLEGCRLVQYDPQHIEFYLNSSYMAFYEIYEHEIRIGPSERFDGSGEMLETITHEVGHHVHTELFSANPELAEKWGELHDECDCVSAYAETSVYEDFAETYAHYICDPEYLEVVSPEKYAFMRDDVFAGREYQE